MRFVSGYLALVTAIDVTGKTAPTEYTSAGYSRQPARFSTPVSGISKLASFVTFGFLGSGTVLGRALYASPSATIPILVLPFGGGARSFPFTGPSDACDVGGITLSFSALAEFPDGQAYAGSLFNFDGGALEQNGSRVVGTTYDVTDEMNAPLAAFPGPGGVLPRNISRAPLYCFSTSATVMAGMLVPAVLASDLAFGS